ncbi:hypothetical protein CBR_g23611 [Chara braunii]|uniref:Integrase catalytic domain-containing protein n=1 Tax=Chara braunii TaxID=69332 RepID=A0A388L4W3_CHABU|nr:hypothetical protein CBR_g23611 [Chara braunii]|eukprot:GBG77282.1 hypothetical protein CBR_g23611 [Chara braunii]
MLRMVKKYCQVGYRDEIDELVRISHDWSDFKARLLEMYQLSDRLLDLQDLRAVDRKTFGTTKQFLLEFEHVARLIPDLSNKDRCLIFLDNFNDVEQSKLVEGMQGRYDWTKVRQNALVGKFDDILYRLLRQQKEEREKVKLREVKDGGIHKTLTCMREMMEGMKEERLKFQVMLAKEKNSKRKGREPVEEESDSESEEEKEPPRKLTKAERKVVNQIQGGQGTSRKQGKNGGQNNQGGSDNASAGSPGQSLQNQGQFQPQDGRGRGRGRGNGQRSRWAWQQEATCNYCAEKGHIMRFCQLLSRDEKEGIVFTTTRGEVFDYEGNLTDPNIEGGMRKEAFRQMGRLLPAMFRIASPEEAWLAEVGETMASLHIYDSSVEPEGFREQMVERAQTITRRLARCRDSSVRLCVDMEEVRPGLPNVFLFGEWGDKREDASGQARTSAPREALQIGPMEKESEKAVEEEPISISENDEDNEDEKLRAEEEERARRRALEREPEKGKVEASDEEPRKKKNIYSIPVEQGVDIERLVDKILESQRDLVTLKEILAVQIGQQEYSTLVDDGAEMNIIRERHAIEAGLKINRDDYGFLVGVGGSTPFCGTASGVLVTVGKVKVRSYFYVLPRVEHEVILGRAFLCRPESIIINKHDGTMFVILCDPVCGYYEVVKCANSGPYCSRNRLNPESYTFPESEKLRRKKESLGEEPNPREFSLTLPDIGQAIDFVSTHAAIDPNVVQAVTKIITDTGSAGTMRLVYSPSEGKSDQAEEPVPVDAFLKEEESRLSINSLAYLTDAATRYGKSIWNAPAFHEVRPELVMEEPFIEEDPWDEHTAEEMMRLTLTDDIDLMLDPLTIEQGHTQADDAFQTVGRMSYIANLLVHEDHLRLMNAEEGGSEVKEAFKEEYEEEYKEIDMWLNGELDESEVDPVVREKSKGFVVRDGHLFKKVADGVPKRVVCGTSRHMDVIAALHDGVAGGHRSARVTLNKIQRLYFWEGMSKMVIDFYKSCFPRQQRFNIRYLEPLNPRYVAEPGAVVHLDLLVMPPGINGYRYIFDARDNLTGFVGGCAIRERTGSVLAECIEEYYLRYPFVQEIVMDRGGEFRAKEVQTFLKRLGVG